MSSLATKESDTRSIVTIVPNNSQSNSQMASKVHIINSMEELERHLEGSKEKVLLIEFFAEWCGPCKLIGAKLEQWAQMYEVTIVKIDVDDLEEVAMNYNISGIPAFLIIKDKQKLEQFEGSQEDRILEMLEKNCPRNPNYVRKPTDNTTTNEQANVTATISTATEGNANADVAQKRE